MERGVSQVSKPLRTVVIGSGNVASAIVPVLESGGIISVRTVCSPTADHARQLADLLHEASVVTSVSDIPRDADLYLVSVIDDAVPLIVKNAPRTPEGVWLHTSGGVDASVMAEVTPNYGVVYPLQTFSKGRVAELDGIPVFVEGSTPKALYTAEMLGRAISSDLRVADGDTRRKLHAAAVFACNFTNYMYTIAADILRREADADLSVLRPLLEETLRKALDMYPGDAQTGPARRGDTAVINRHMGLLKPDEAAIYKILSDSIMKRYE